MQFPARSQSECTCPAIKAQVRAWCCSITLQATMTVTKRAPANWHHAGNRPSRLLTQDENDTLDKLIGRDFQALVSAVVQVYIPEPPERTEWMKLHCGVLCVLKDRSSGNGYLLLRVYCLVRKMILWEQTVHERLKYFATCAFFHTLSVDGIQIGLNFADETEARLVLATVCRPIPAVDHPHKLTKGDIGMPTDFRLVSHVGWDPRTGFTMHNVNQDIFNFFTVQAGVLEKRNSGEPADDVRACWNRACSYSALSRKKKLTKEDISPPYNFRHVSSLNLQDRQGSLSQFECAYQNDR